MPLAPPVCEYFERGWPRGPVTIEAATVAPARVSWIAFLRVIFCMGFSRDGLRRTVALLCRFLVHLAAEDAESAEEMPGGWITKMRKRGTGELWESRIDAFCTDSFVGTANGATRRTPMVNECGN